MRRDGRAPDELRPVRITVGYQDYPEGSALIETGDTRVICAATVEERVPPWLLGSGQGWVTGEYAMLPRSTKERVMREERWPRARTLEIRRLIGRSLRAAVNLGLLGEHTVLVDCDVVQADGGTRTAAITGGYVALALAMRQMIEHGRAAPGSLLSQVAAVSVGVVQDDPLLDLSYAEDSQAQVDFNVVMTEGGRFVEVQGTGEGGPFSRETLDGLMDLAQTGIAQLLAAQKAALKGAG